MEFTYSAYQKFIQLLENENYLITNYHEYSSLADDCELVILRHDIDFSIQKALDMARIENDLGVKSTYFVLVTSEFYNVGMKKNKKMLNKIYDMGHEIGLHFDEACYEDSDINRMIFMAEEERNFLQNIIEVPVTTVSMHRPSKMMLEKNIQFKSMVNSYSDVFFKKFKYLSDSRMHWRENVEEIIKSHRYHCLHILTHAFWYDERKNMGIREKIMNFIIHAQEERYCRFNENFRDLDEFITMEDVVNEKNICERNDRVSCITKNGIYGERM